MSDKELPFDDSPPWNDNVEGASKVEQLEPKIISPYEHYFKRANREVQEGMAGRSVWIPFGLGEMGQKMEIAQRTYTLLGGAPGTGKTALAHALFILGPYSWWRRNKDNTDVKLKIVLRNMERPMHMLINKWVALYLHSKYKILVDVRFLMGRGQQKSKVSQELYEKICEAYDYFREMMNIMVIKSRMENPTGIYKHLQKIALESGKVVKTDSYGGEHYIPNDENLITLIVVDHIGRIQPERGFGPVELLKKMSEYLSNVRDMYGFSPVVLNQFNRGIQDPSRRKDGGLIPEEKDFKGAANMYEDADVAMALFNPWKYKLSRMLGYNIGAMRNAEGYNRFRSLHILKNSQGIDDFDVPLHFIGETGEFSEMPLLENMDEAAYSKLTNLRSSI